MGRCTRSQGLAAFRSNMAARFWQNQIPQKNLALLHDLETCHELKSISRSFVEVHSYPKLFFHCRVAKSGLLYEKEEAYSSHVSRHIPKIIQPPYGGADSNRSRMQQNQSPAGLNFNFYDSDTTDFF